MLGTGALSPASQINTVKHVNRQSIAKELPVIAVTNARSLLPHINNFQRKLFIFPDHPDNLPNTPLHSFPASAPDSPLHNPPDNLPSSLILLMFLLTILMSIPLTIVLKIIMTFLQEIILPVLLTVLWQS